MLTGVLFDKAQLQETMVAGAALPPVDDVFTLDVSCRPVAALDQGQESEAFGVQPGAGSVRMKPPGCS